MKYCPPTDRTAGLVAGSTAVGLASIGALHVAWGRGSTRPFSTRERLNDAVVGRQTTPSPAACYSVAALLAGSAAAVADARVRGSRWSRVMSSGVGAVLAVRAALGVMGRTELAVPGSNSPPFRRLDQTVYAPLCAALATGAWVAAGSRR